MLFFLKKYFKEHRMKIHEYQAKELFRKYNIPVAESSVAFSYSHKIQLDSIISIGYKPSGCHT
jgi:hypothetical protein